MSALLLSSLLTSLWLSPTAIAGTELNQSRAKSVVASEQREPYQSHRPAVLTTLYVAHGALQATDIYSTSKAIRAAARESNPALAPFAGSVVGLTAVKTATTAATVYFIERMWRRNKVAAVVVMAALNGAVAAVSIHNARVSRRQERF